MEEIHSRLKSLSNFHVGPPEKMRDNFGRMYGTRTVVLTTHSELTPKQVRDSARATGLHVEEESDSDGEFVSFKISNPKTLVGLPVSERKELQSHIDSQVGELRALGVSVPQITIPTSHPRWDVLFKRVPSRVTTIALAVRHHDKLGDLTGADREQIARFLEHLHAKVGTGKK